MLETKIFPCLLLKMGVKLIWLVAEITETPVFWLIL